MFNMAIWDLFIGLGFLLQILFLIKPLKGLKRDDPVAFAWACTTLHAAAYIARFGIDRAQLCIISYTFAQGPSSNTQNL